MDDEYWKKELKEELEEVLARFFSLYQINFMHENFDLHDWLDILDNTRLAENADSEDQEQ